MQNIVMQSQPSPRWREVVLSWMDPRSSVLTGKNSSKPRFLTPRNSHSQVSPPFFSPFVVVVVVVGCTVILAFAF